MLGPALGVGATVVAVEGFGRATGSFHAGLAIGMTAVGLIGILLRLRDRPARGPDGVAWRPMAVGAAMATAMLAPAAILWSFHDELIYQGHMAISSQLLNGGYPPRAPTFPEFELRYHHGFNVLVAAIVALTRLDVPAAIDAVTLACWAYSWCLAWGVGERAVGVGRGSIAAAVTLLGAGLPWLLHADEATWSLGVLGLGEVGGVSLNPPLVSYAFQHPWTLGQPLALAVLLLHLGDSRSRTSRAAGYAVLLTALAASQFVLFVTVGASVAAVELIAGGRRGAWAGLAGLAAAVAVGWCLGGFFLPPPDPADAGFRLRLGVVADVDGNLRWHMINFGVVLPLAFAGLPLLARGKVAIGLLAGGSLAVLNGLDYVHSWDIAKFASVAALAAGVAASAAVARVWALRPRGLGIAGGVAIVVACVAAGVAFPLAFVAGGGEVPASVFPKGPDRVTEADVAAIGWLRGHARNDEGVYRAVGASGPYAQRGGLAQPWYDAMTPSYGFAPARLAARARFLTEPPDDPDAFLAQRVRWLVLGPNDGRLRGLVERWESNGRAEWAATFGRLTIHRIRDRNAAGGPR